MKLTNYNKEIKILNFQYSFLIKEEEEEITPFKIDLICLICNFRYF